MSKWPSDSELKRVREKLNDGLASHLLPEDASLLDQVKYEVCEKIVLFQIENSLSGRELAQKMKIDEAIVSKIIHYHIDRFTLDKLLSYLVVIYDDVSFKVDVA